MSAAGWGIGTQTGSGDPTTRDPIKRFTIGPDKPVKRASEMPEKERITFAFNPTAPEEWRSTAPVVIQLYASQLMSQEEARERLGLGPVKKNETFAPDPTQMTPGQANKITTNPRTQAGLPTNKGLVSKPPEQQEKPKEVTTGTAGLAMPELVSDEPIVQPLVSPKKKKAKEKWQVDFGKDDRVILERVEE